MVVVVIFSFIVRPSIHLGSESAVTCQTPLSAVGSREQLHTRLASRSDSSSTPNYLFCLLSYNFVNRVLYLCRLTLLLTNSEF